MLSGKYLEERVRKLLSPMEENHKAYQTSDLKLMARVWYDDLNRIHYNDIESISAIKFLAMLRDGELTKSESVTRCSRKLQAKYPELRDDKVYKGRHKQEKVMREKSQYY